MKTLSDADFLALVSVLTDVVDSYKEEKDLRAYNKHRRRKMLLRKLNKKLHLS